ncbi:CD209 antigen-like protein B isoform X2 [Mya arenaria]|uniref:CD209 antigen-like protein B isoform X2 n=1 Tax=Mya arenaria TaxID=6604 RepID=UPI0022E18E92|nr:CD209 antigen-like protein B isoform X2 [Mya arenaria]
MHFGTCVIAIVIAIVQTALTTPQFYCKNGEIQQISNFTDGIIKTRETEDGFHGDNLKCSWQIVAPSNWRVKVTVTQLDLDWSSSYSTCDAYDRVNIWEGSNQEGEKLTAICVAWNPGTILSVGNSVFLQFSSTPRNAYQRRGVEMFFEIYDPSNCPPGWIPVPSSSSECLMVERNLTADWSRSQDICKFNKANLASLHSIDEMDALFLTGTGKGIFPAWIGLNDKDGNGQFTWIDRSDLSFQRSIVNQSYKNLCVAQGFDATDWLARECREKLPYICRGNKGGQSQRKLTYQYYYRTGNKGSEILLYVQGDKASENLPINITTVQG